MTITKCKPYIELAASIAAIITSVIIPIYSVYAPSDSFTAVYHIDPVAFPAAQWVTSDPTIDNAKNPPLATSGQSALKEKSKELLTVVIKNNGQEVRHNVSIDISYVKQLGGVGIASQPIGITGLEKWSSPIFKDTDNSLQFTELPYIPAKGSIQLSIWGQFDSLFQTMEVRSAEGMASVVEGAITSGWRLILFSNLWWIATLFFLIVGLVLLRGFERRKI
jgi:hypothetical protein